MGSCEHRRVGCVSGLGLRAAFRCVSLLSCAGPVETCIIRTLRAVGDRQHNDVDRTSGPQVDLLLLLLTVTRGETRLYKASGGLWVTQSPRQASTSPVTSKCIGASKVQGPVAEQIWAVSSSDSPLFTSLHNLCVPCYTVTLYKLLLFCTEHVVSFAGSLTKVSHCNFLSDLNCVLGSWTRARELCQ